MPQPFTTCFTFLHRKTTMDTVSCFCLRKRQNNNNNNNKRLPSFISEFSTSFVNMELSTQFQQVFNLIDTNGDGKISAAELGDVLSCLGYKRCAAAKEAEGMVRVLDFNGDGFVDMDEFMVVMREMEGGNDGNKGGKEEQDMCLMDAFLVFDADRNGLISPKELRRVLLNLGCHDCSLRECKRMIKGVDKNGDGFVDFDEFRSMMKKGLVAK